MEHLRNLFARCDRDCVSDRCLEKWQFPSRKPKETITFCEPQASQKCHFSTDDYGADSCADWHTEAEHFEPGHDFCGKMAFLSHGCDICQEMLAIYQDIKDGKTPQRECRKCGYLYDLDCSENPYGEVQWDTDTEAVYFECGGCLTLEGEPRRPKNVIPIFFDR